MNDNTTPNVVITQGTKPRDNTLTLDITEVAQARLQRRSLWFAQVAAPAEATD